VDTYNPDGATSDAMSKHTWRTMNVRVDELGMHAIQSLGCAIQMTLPSDVARLLQTRNRSKPSKRGLLGSHGNFFGAT
jgi:hypothetical protein